MNPVPEALKDALSVHIQESERLLACTAMEALATGLLARQIKALLPHGEFGPWLKTNLFPKTDNVRFQSHWRKVQRSMQFSEAVQTFVKCDTVSHLNGMEWLQGAYVAVTRTMLDEEEDDVWVAWMAGVTELIHENTQRDLILELRAAGEENHQVYTPSDPVRAEQMELKLVTDTFNDLRGQLVGSLTHKWQLLQKPDRWEFVDATLPVVEIFALNTDWSPAEKKALRQRLIEISSRLA